LLSSSAGLRFLCYAHPQLETNRWLLFFGQRQLSPNLTVSSHDAGQLAAPNGDLWIGYFRGGVSLLRNGRLINYTERDGLPTGAVRKLAQEPEFQPIQNISL